MSLTEEQRAFLENQKRDYYDTLSNLNSKIHTNPACGYTIGEKETKDNICKILKDIKFPSAPSGFFNKVEDSVTAGDVLFETAFQWDIGVWEGNTLANAPAPVVFNAEYDSLPFEKGPLHACGHNLIATGSIAAAIFAANAMIRRKESGWHIRVFGTPSEEINGAKTEFAKRGLYDGCLGCMMCHPIARPDNITANGVAMSPSLANKNIWAIYKGIPAHAGLSPWKGLNALDAAVTAYNAISMLRQQVLPSNRICAIINCENAPNVIPEYAKITVGVRAETEKDLDTLTDRVRACFDAGALATHCEILSTMPGDDVGQGDDYKLGEDINWPGEKPFKNENANETEANLDTISNDLICGEFTSAINELGIEGFLKNVPKGDLLAGLRVTLSRNLLPGHSIAIAFIFSSPCIGFASGPSITFGHKRARSHNFSVGRRRQTSQTPH
ncbi:hypothetical protein BGZ60DRAFT_557831 [Tricladium varicosporioides]|nr:hypothetical protein BGZ60DRAFT_557831 [Hymenoscyphus varicosporioides]